MKKGLTELVFILDRSGSMSGLENDTIGGFNSLIGRQRLEKGECLVSTVLFNEKSVVLHDRIALDRVPEMKKEDYVPSGMTALIDAIGGAIRHIRNIHKYARAEDVPERTLFVITTDGLENASRNFSADDVRRMIERQKEENNWEFLFIGANIDAYADGYRNRCADCVYVCKYPQCDANGRRIGAWRKVFRQKRCPHGCRYRSRSDEPLYI